MLNPRSVLLLLSVWPCLLLAVAAGERPLASKPKENPGVAKDDPTLQTDADWVDARWQKTDVGQFLCATVETPRHTTAHGVAIKVGAQDEATVCFDSDLLRYSAMWTGGFLELHPRRFGLLMAPKPAGNVVFASRPVPGWARDGSFADPRPQRLGPLPQDWARYRGLYLSGKRVAIAYTVSGVNVLESPWFEAGDAMAVFTRTFDISRREQELTLRACELPESAALVQEEGGIRVGLLRKGSDLSAVAIRGDATLEAGADASLRVRIPAGPGSTLKLFYWQGAPSDLGKFAALVKTVRAGDDVGAFTNGGVARWTNAVTTRGTTGFGAGPLVIDTLAVPYDNPWNALMFTSGHDFFSNGDIAVSTAHGDVWRVSGLDARLQKLTWKRIATGLHQPLGLKVIGDLPYVLCRDQIVVLRDLNGDGEADFYENFNNGVLGLGGGHSYTTCLETDSKGDFYFLKCAEGTPHGGTLLRVPKDGSRVDVIATGFRNPNGMGIAPDNTITVGDQQGEWVPETRLDVIRPGGFYGFMPMHKRATKPERYDAPLCWITRTLDNSAGGDTWVPTNHWGALAGQLIHLSYGRCTLMMVLRDERNPAQGGVVPLPGKFVSGAMRARFSPHDGHLYVTGLRGWQTAALRDGCLQRVRHTGAPVYLPVAFSAHSNGIRLTFSKPLDRATAADSGSFSAKQWNFRWTEKYGSPDYSVRDPEREGRDEVVVSGARLLGDGRSVMVELADLRAAMQTEIKYNLKAADGKTMRGEFYLTIHRLAPPPGP